MVLAHLDKPNPPAEVYTKPVHPDMVRRYVADLDAFEAIIMAPH